MPQDRRSESVGCLLIPHLPLACELVRCPELRDRPAIVTQPRTSHVWDASPAAEQDGVAIGQTLSEALGRCPSLVVFEGRPADYEQRWEPVLTVLEATVGGVEPGRPGIAYVDLGRMRNRPVRALHRSLLNCAPGELGPRLGVGPSKFVALLAAHAAVPSSVKTIGEAELERFLVDRSVDILPVSAEMRRRLRLLGIDTLGQLAGLAPQAVAAQFGAEGELAHRLARGKDDAPVRPRPIQDRIRERVRFDEPLVSHQALVPAVEQALNAALRRPARRERAARQMKLRLETEGGGRWERVVTCKEARADRIGLWRALEPVLADVQLSGPVCEVSIELRQLVPVRYWQEELLPARSPRQERLEEGLRRLKARYGFSPVSRVVQVEPWSRIPERRLALIDLDP